MLVDFGKSTNDSTPAGEQRGVGAAVQLPAARERAELLYREHMAFVWRNARRLGCTDDWVDDAVHEVFLVAHRRLDEFQARSAVRTWLFAITYRVVARMRRDRSRRRQRVQRYLSESSEAIRDAASENEAAEYLRHLLLRLSEPQRLVLILAELEGFTSREIAETLGIPAGTVDSRLRAAREQLSWAHQRERAQDQRWR